MNSWEEEGLRLYGLVVCIVVDIKYDNGLLWVFFVLVMNLWYRSFFLLESVVLLVSDSGWLYELLGFMILSVFFCMVFIWFDR